MKFPQGSVDLGAESFEETAVSKAALEARLTALVERLAELAESDDPALRTGLELEQARILLELERPEAAWPVARTSFDRSIADGSWEAAARACEIMFLCDRPDSLAALGQGVWLAVTFPVDPELTVKMLQYIVEQTPDDSDGAAVAAATAAYVVDLRTQGKQRDDLHFFAAQLLGAVARRHSQVQGQDQFDAWMRRLELYDPERFLVRLRNVVDVLVQDQWWFDADRLRAQLPVH